MVWILGFELKIFGSQKLGFCVTIIASSPPVLHATRGVSFFGLDICFCFNLFYLILMEFFVDF